MAILVFLGAFLVACAAPKTPDLLTLESVGPGALEPDGDINIVGSGFPEGRRGWFELRGVVHTPARAPRAAEWRLPIIAESQSAIFVRPELRQLQRFTEGAAHVTFRGEARIEFDPIVEGRPPLKGTKKDIVLDVFTPGSGRTEDPDPFLAFLGLALGTGMEVTEVERHSVASRAGLRVGDQLHELDGVRLDSDKDFLPQARARTSVVVYSRGESKKRGEAQLERSDFQIMDDTVGARALAIIAGVVLALVWIARPPRVFLWLFGEKSPARRGAIVWLSGAGQRVQSLAYPTFFLVVVGFWCLGLGGSSSLAGMEFIALLAAGSLLSLAPAFLLGGKRAQGSGFSLLGALSGALLRLLVLVPVFIAALARASDAGSLHLLEMARDQGSLLPAWGLFDSPVSFVLGLCYLVALVPIAGRRAPLEGHPGSDSGSTFARLCEWTGHLALLGLWVVLFAVAPWTGGRGDLVGGVVFSLEMALLSHVVAWVRARTGHLRLGESWGLFACTNVIVSLVTSGTGVLLLFLGVAKSQAEVLGLFSATLCGSLLLLLFVGSQRSWAHMGRRSDPWI